MDGWTDDGAARRARARALARWQSHHSTGVLMGAKRNLEGESDNAHEKKKKKKCLGL
jgi:hypothetical protein